MIIFMPAIGTPLPQVAVHIVKSKAIGREVADFRGLFSGLALGSIAIRIVSNVVHQIGRDGDTKMERGGGVCPTGIFPFGFAG